MAKGQQRSNREAKKPKQPKSATKPAAPAPLAAPERKPMQGRGQPPRR